MNNLLKKIRDGWATRSLAVGAASTLIDLAVGGAILYFDNSATRLAAMSGIAVATPFAFVANRLLAFRDTRADWKMQAVRYSLSMALAIIAHGQVVVWLRDDFQVPYAVAKIIADFVVFTLGQLVVLRFIVFPKKEDDEGPKPPLPGAP